MAHYQEALVQTKSKTLLLQADLRDGSRKWDTFPTSECFPEELRRTHQKLAIQAKVPKRPEFRKRPLFASRFTKQPFSGLAWAGTTVDIKSLPVPCNSLLEVKSLSPPSRQMKRALTKQMAIFPGRSDGDPTSREILLQLSAPKSHNRNR